jgi:hypothetical protein
MDMTSELRVHFTHFKQETYVTENVMHDSKTKMAAASQLNAGTITGHRNRGLLNLHCTYGTYHDGSLMGNAFDTMRRYWSKNRQSQLNATTTCHMLYPYKTNSFFRRTVFTELVKYYPPFVESGSSSPCSQETAIGPYPEPNKSSQHRPTMSL